MSETTVVSARKASENFRIDSDGLEGFQMTHPPPTFYGKAKEGAKAISLNCTHEASNIPGCLMMKAFNNVGARRSMLTSDRSVIGDNLWVAP